MPRKALLLLLVVLLVPSCSLFRRRAARPVAFETSGGPDTAPAPETELSRRVQELDLEAAVTRRRPTKRRMVGPWVPVGEHPASPALSGATYEPEPNVVGTVVAVVNGDIITKEDVLGVIRPELEAIDADPDLTDAGQEAKRRELISRTVMIKVERALALQEARRVIPEEENERIEYSVDTLVKDTIRRVGTVTQLEGTLAERGRTLSAHKQAEIDSRRIQALLAREVDAHVDVTPAEMLRYYEAHKADFREKGQVQIRQIFLLLSNYASKDEAVAKGRDLLGRIRKGEDFGRLAEEYSDGPYAKKGGLWEFVTEGSGAFRPKVEKAAFSLAPKAVSDVIVSEIGVHLIKVEDVHPARTAPFTEVQDQISKKLGEQKRDELYRQFIKKLWDKSYVDIRWK